MKTEAEFVFLAISDYIHSIEKADSILHFSFKFPYRNLARLLVAQLCSGSAARFGGGNHSNGYPPFCDSETKD